MANIVVTYFLWLVGGWFGLHHFYLKRDKHAFVWWCLPGGYFGLGWVRDLWRIPEYVREANHESAWRLQQEEKQRQSELPPWKMARWMGMLVVGNMFGMLPAMATPNKDDLGLDLTLAGTLLTPLGCALGVWLVGNIGRWRGSMVRPLIGCYATLPAYLYGMNIISWTTIIGAYCFKREWKSMDVSQPRSWYIRLLILTLCAALYASMWGSYVYYNCEVVHNGEKIKLRDAVGNFMKSQAVQEFWKNLQQLYAHMQHNGFWSTWSQLVESLDPFGEKNALKVMGLGKGATQEEIRSKYRELTKTYHPDKVQGTAEEKEAAHEKFVQIQQAYEKLSTLKKSRAKANKKHQTVEPEPAASDVKIEL